MLGTGLIFIGGFMALEGAISSLRAGRDKPFAVAALIVLGLQVLVVIGFLGIMATA